MDLKRRKKKTDFWRLAYLLSCLHIICNSALFYPLSREGLDIFLRLHSVYVYRILQPLPLSPRSHIGSKDCGSNRTRKTILLNQRTNKNLNARFTLLKKELKLHLDGKWTVIRKVLYLTYYDYSINQWTREELLQTLFCSSAYWFFLWAFGTCCESAQTYW